MLPTILPNDPPFLFLNPKNRSNDSYGLVAIGGDLSCQRLLYAYKNGIFPWFSENEPILWWAPDPRCVLYPADFYQSHSLKKLIKNKEYYFKINANFTKTITSCAKVKRKGEDGTWINNKMIKAYVTLHKKKIAHSYEIYKNQRLIGGLYGIQIGDVFFGESMFHTESNASKLALYHLCQNKKIKIIDCQIPNAHLLSLGAKEIPLRIFLEEIKTLKKDIFT
jgi:leucyl/phenylalanyl-tRNA---protein transferase